MSGEASVALAPAQGNSMLSLALAPAQGNSTHSFALASAKGNTFKDRSGNCVNKQQRVLTGIS